MLRAATNPSRITRDPVSLSVRRRRLFLADPRRRPRLLCIRTLDGITTIEAYKVDQEEDEGRRRGGWKKRVV